MTTTEQVHPPQSSASQQPSASHQADVRNYILVTLAYWAGTLTDGAIRMLVLFYWASVAFVLAAGLLSRLLPRQIAPRTKPIALGDLGE